MIINVSKEMRSRDYNMRDLNYQNVCDNGNLSREVELLQRDLHDERGHRSKLELLEGDLIHKL